MRPIRPALDQFVAELKAAGFRAEVDPEQLTIESVGLWVQPRTRTDMRLDGGGTLVCWVYLVCSNTETLRAIDLLDDALSGLLELAPLSDTDSNVDLAAAVILPTSPNAPLPAYRVAVDLDL